MSPSRSSVKAVSGIVGELEDIQVFRRDHAKREDPRRVIQQMYDLTIWLMERVEKFPRSSRFVLGDRVEESALFPRPRGSSFPCCAYCVPTQNE